MRPRTSNRVRCIRRRLQAGLSARPFLPRRRQRQDGTWRSPRPWRGDFSTRASVFSPRTLRRNARAGIESSLRRSFEIAFASAALALELSAGPRAQQHRRISTAARRAARARFGRAGSPIALCCVLLTFASWHSRFASGPARFDEPRTGGQLRALRCDRRFGLMALASEPFGANEHGR